jgi:cytochrome c biogenesis protein
MDYLSYLKEQEQDTEPKPKKRDLWAMLSTMKFAIWILIILGIMSLVSMFVGEFWNPERMAEQGLRTPSSIEPMLRAFQMDNPFRSWWYRLLLVVLNLSLFACVLKRMPVIWKLWISQPPIIKSIRTPQSDLTIFRQVSVQRDKLLAKFGGAWKFRVKTDDVWVAEKSRFGMWGPLLTHLGMLLLGVGALVSSFGGFTTRAGGFAGDVVEVEGMPFTVQLDSFRIAYYPLQPGQWVAVDDQWVGRLIKKNASGDWLIERGLEGTDETEMTTAEASRIKNRFNNDMDRGNIERYSSYVTILENGQSVHKAEIAVNSPLRRHGFRLYQSSYEPSAPRVMADYRSATLAIKDSAGQTVQTLTLPMGKETAIPGDTLLVTAGRLLPNFKVGSDFKGYSASGEFINPAVELTFRGPKGFSKSQWSFPKFQGHDSGPGKFSYNVTAYDGERVTTELRTIWEVKKTHGMEFLWAGFIIGSIGLLLCFYVTHRILTINWPNAEHAETVLMGISRKTPHLFARELDHILDSIGARAS